MTPDELLFALAPDGRAAKAARESLQGLSSTQRSAEGYLSGRCHGSGPTPYTVVAHLGESFRSQCDCGSMKYPCKHALALAFLSLEAPDRFATFTPLPTQVRSIDEAPPLPLPTPPPAPSSAGEALLQAIFACPSDDAARLIYADWLTDHGSAEDQALAEFIHVETSLLREGATPQRLADQRRLLAAHRDRWLAHVPPALIKKVSTIGGFVRSVTLTWTHLRQHGEVLGAHYPIDVLNVGGKLDLRTAGKVAVLPMWERIRTLTLRGIVPRPALEIVIRSHYLSAVRNLTLFHGEMSVHLVRLLAGWRDRDKLESLTLHNTDLTSGAMSELADIFAPTLKLLTLLSTDPIPAPRLLKERFGERLVLESGQ